MKTFPLMISKRFPHYHPRKGEPTNFREQIEFAVSGKRKVVASTWVDTNNLTRTRAELSEERGKIHTMRENYDHWARIADKVNSGYGVLSLRQWTGSPYNRMRDGSKAEEFLRLPKISVQRASITIYHVTQAPLPAMDIKGGSYLSMGTIKVDGKEIQHYREFYSNDGFSGLDASEDFKHWFGACIYDNMALIHFTPFRYQ